jgi:hypothetical protein
MTENGFPLISKKPPELHNQETSSSGPGNNLPALRLFYFLCPAPKFPKHRGILQEVFHAK